MVLSLQLKLASLCEFVPSSFTLLPKQIPGASSVTLLFHLLIFNNPVPKYWYISDMNIYFHLFTATALGHDTIITSFGEATIKNTIERKLST